MPEYNKIETGIPIPGAGRNSKYSHILEQLEVGQSVLFNSLIANVTVSCRRLRKKTGRNFRSKTVEGGVRVWRIE